MRTLAIIPARGGSVRLPRKNVLAFMGEPLIHWTVRAAIESGVLDRVIVNTDDPEIAEAGLAAGAEVPFLRPAHLATSEATSFDVVDDTLQRLGTEPEYIVLLQPTSPLRVGSDVREAHALIERTNAPAVVSVSAFDKLWPVMRQITPSGELLQAALPLEGPPTHQLNGAIYCERVAAWRQARSFTPPGTRPYVMPPERSVDIDTALDFAVAQAVAAQFPELFEAASA